MSKDPSDYRAKAAGLIEHAEELEQYAAGLEPDSVPKSIDENDKELMRRLARQAIAEDAQARKHRAGPERASGDGNHAGEPFNGARGAVRKFWI